MSSFVRQQSQGKKLKVGLSTDSTHTSSLKNIDTTSAKPVRRESRLTFGGLVYITMTVFMAIGAINSQNNLLFWLFGVSIATLIVSGLFSGNALMNIRLEAQAVTDSFSGESVSMHYWVSNSSRFFPLFAALITEIPSDAHPAGQFKPTSIMHLGPKDRIRINATLTPTSRGRYSLNQIRLSTQFPFGLLRKSLIFECHRTITVLPYRLAIKPELVRIVKGHGEEVRKRTMSNGQSTEYWGLREYTPGDPKRSIAWKQSARHGKLVVIDHAQPIATKLWIWIAAQSLHNASDSDDRKNAERAIALGASLVIQAAKRGIPVGIWMPSRDIVHAPYTGQASMMRCLRSLGLLDLSTEPAADIAPRASSSDDVLALIPASSSRVPAGALRALSVDDPSQWLVDRSTLPLDLDNKALDNKEPSDEGEAPHE
ncbi:MAG: DUF58 domain-containing protein [Phycisphaerales bacterium]|nr:DUF58 domain-containing protein [Phycisphaerales bacterium]